MSQELLNKVAESSMKEDVPKFKIGDTVNVSVRIVEGDKERIQIFTGTVISRKGSGIGETFTVRRIVNNEGVERIFPIHSPKVAGIEVVRSGKVRRAKLYYLRDRIGKATRLKEIRTSTGKAVGQVAETDKPSAAEDDQPSGETEQAAPAGE